MLDFVFLKSIQAIIIVFADFEPDVILHFGIPIVKAQNLLTVARYMQKKEIK